MDLDEYHYEQERKAAYYRRTRDEPCPDCENYGCLCQAELDEF